jgi:hypothetical protein
MSLRVGRTEQQYITTLSKPYNGYSVAIPHPERVGEYVRKNFCGVTWTQEEYLLAAIAWRDSTYREPYNGELPKRIFHRQQSNSKTKTPGVRRLEKLVVKKLKDGTVKKYCIPCIIAEISTPTGKDYERARGVKTKLFSIAKYGEGEAMRLAVQWRKTMEAGLAGAESPHSPGDLEER